MTKRENRPRSLYWLWYHKFVDAFRGIYFGIRGEPSFVAHFLVATTVLICAAVWRLETWQWAMLLLCVTVVLTAEMFNSAIERLAAAMEREDPRIGAALDIAAGAVLVASIGAAAAGILIFFVPMFF